MTEAQKQITPLVIASVTMFISLLFGMKVAGVGLLLWVLTVFWTMNRAIFSRFKPKDLVEVNDKIVEEGIKNKKYFKSSIHFSAMPMMAIGLLWIFITIFFMIFIL